MSGPTEATDTVPVLRRILELDRRLAAASGPGSLARAVVEWACGCGASAAWVGHSEDSTTLSFDAQAGEGMSEYLARAVIRVDESPEGNGPAGHAWRDETLQLVDDWEQLDAGRNPWREALARAGWRSSAVVPLLGPDGVVAIAAFYSHEPSFFAAPFWRGLLEHLSVIAGVTLHRLEQRRQLEDLAHTDPLTGLANRRALESLLERVLAEAARRDTQAAIAVLDLDDFRALNERHGRRTCDLVLKMLACRLRRALEPGATVARVGGDEFAVVFEDFGTFEALDTHLEHLHRLLEEPIEADGAQLGVQARLGLAVYPLHERQANPVALLRLAEQALHRAKLGRATDPTQWWMLAGEALERPASGSDEVAYGPTAERLLSSLHAANVRLGSRFAEIFEETLAAETEPAATIEALDAEELEALRRDVTAYFRRIMAPNLEQGAHREAAHQAGRVLAVFGVDVRWLIHAFRAWLDSLERSFAPETLRLRLAQPVLGRRFGLELEFQLAGREEVEKRHEEVLRRIEGLAWQAEHYTDLTEGTVQALLGLEEVTAASIARPDARGILQYEAVAGLPLARLAECGARLQAAPVEDHPDAPAEVHPGIRAWRSGEIEHVRSCRALAQRAPRPEASPSAGAGARAFVPLGVRGATAVLLQIHSDYPGGLTGAAQRALLAHLQRTLSLGLQRLRGEEGSTRTQAVTERGRFRRLLASGAMEMHYQPIVDLRDGRLVKVEALARLREAGGWITPVQFLPAFGQDDLFRLYELGIDQSLATLARWAATGFHVGLSLNLPPQAFSESRYLEVTRRALAARPLPQGQRLSLEILETGALDSDTAAAALGAWRALGVELTEDDLGSGFSSLTRLRHVPFEVVKIDQGLVRGAALDPQRVTGFIARMTDLADEAGAKVVVEGLESAALIEAAATVGAQFGQGFAISRPLTAGALFDWARDYTPVVVDPNRPRSALGALAGSLRWGLRLRLLTSWPEMVRQAAALTCPVHHYLREHGLESSVLGETHRAMHAAESTGHLGDPDYQELRARYASLLAAQVLIEEGAPPDLPD